MSSTGFLKEELNRDSLGLLQSFKIDSRNCCHQIIDGSEFSNVIQFYFPVHAISVLTHRKRSNGSRERTNIQHGLLWISNQFRCPSSWFFFAGPVLPAIQEKCQVRACRKASSGSCAS